MFFNSLSLNLRLDADFVANQTRLRCLILGAMLLSLSYQVVACRKQPQAANASTLALRSELGLEKLANVVQKYADNPLACSDSCN